MPAISSHVKPVSKVKNFPTSHGTDEPEPAVYRELGATKKTGLSVHTLSDSISHLPQLP